MGSSIRTHFRQLAAIPPEERGEYYGQRDVSTELREELESLLYFDGAGGETLAGRVGAATERFLISNAPVSEEGRCGPYRLIRLLGNGGMGAVYLAERADGEIQQQVAIKFLRTGASQPALRDRFLQERQILASLNHPGVARLLDAGHSGGHPYLVMEAVDGTRIDEYARELGEREIAMLIIRVAEAVSYAHRNLVVHRDIKPSNILVDASGQPKLLDFGIAKILDADEQTRTVLSAMTPEYASPEQLRGEAQATPTDIYSLGAVLRKLLSGRTIPEDLAAIISKAMREEPEARYASADLLIADLRAYLEHCPVQARRGNALYLTRKFVRRRWFAIAAAGLAIGGLTAGILVANHERAIAQRRFEQVRRLSKQFLDLDAELQKLPGSTKARGRIVTASLEYLERLAAEAGNDAALALELAGSYVQVARLQGVPIGPNLGQFQQAQATLRRAHLLLEPVLARLALPNRRAALLLSAEVARDTMILEQTAGRNAETLVWARLADDRLREFLALPELTRAEQAGAARIYTNMALALSNIHRVEEAARHARRATELARNSGDERQLSRALGVLSNTARFSGDLDGALKAIRESRMLAEKLGGDSVESTLQLCGAIWREGLVLGEADAISLERPREAIRLLQRAFDLAESQAARDPHDYGSRSYVTMAGRELGELLLLSDPARALAVFEHTYRRSNEMKNNPKARREDVWLLRGSASALRKLGRTGEARQKIGQAVSLVRELRLDKGPAEPGEPADVALRGLGEHYAETGNISAALPVYEDLGARLAASHPNPETDLRHASSLSRFYRDLGNLYRLSGQGAKAAELRERQIGIWLHWSRQLPGNRFVKHQIELARNDFSR